MSTAPSPIRPAARRRFLIALAFLVALMVGARVALPLAAKRAIGWAGQRALGFEAGAADVDLQLLRGRVTVNGLWMHPPRADAAPTGRSLIAERVALDLALRELVSRQVRVTRVRVEGLALRIERGAEGRIDLLPEVAAGSATTPESTVAPAPPAQAPSPTDDPRAVDDGGWPIRIDEIALRAATLRVSDAVDRAELATLGIDELDLDDLVVAAGPTRLGRLALRGATVRAQRAFALAMADSGETDDVRVAGEPLEEYGAQIGLISVEDFALHLIEGERSLDMGLRFQAEEVDLGKGKRFPAHLVAEVGDGRLELEGEAGFSPPMFHGKAVAKELPVPELALLAGVDAAAWARSGSASFDATLRANADGVGFQGRTTLEALDWADPQSDASRVAWKRLYAGIHEASIPLGDATRAVSLRLALLRVVEPRIAYTQESGAQADAAELTAGAAPQAQVAIERVEITGGELGITDRTVTPTFRTQVRELELSALEVDPLAPSAGQMELAALLNGGSRLTAQGGLGPGRGSVDVHVERLALPPVNSYAREIGLQVQRGSISLDSNVQVDGDRWEVDSDLVLHRLQLDREQSKTFLERIDLPFDLVMALLRDAKGDVRLPVPLVFDREGAEAGFTEILIGALRGALLAAAGAPLRTGGFLLSLAGGEVSLEPLRAEPGRLELRPEAIERSARLAEVLEARPDLVLGLAGRVGPTDRDALARAVLLERVAGGEELPPLPAEPLDFATRRRLEEALRQRAEGHHAELEPEDEELLARVLQEVEVPEAQLATLAASRAERAREVLLASGRVEPRRVVLRGAAPPGDPGVVLDMTQADGEPPAEAPLP